MVRFSCREGIENQCILAGELCLMVRFSWREGIENQCILAGELCLMVRLSGREGIENQCIGGCVYLLVGELCLMVRFSGKSVYTLGVEVVSHGPVCLERGGVGGIEYQRMQCMYSVILLL